MILQEGSFHIKKAGFLVHEEEEIFNKNITIPKVI